VRARCGGVDGGDCEVDEAVCERARRFAEWISLPSCISRAELGSLSRGRSIDTAGAALIPLELHKREMLQYAPSATARYLPEAGCGICSNRGLNEGG